MDREQMRASEQDRQMVLDTLRVAVEEGRLDVTEYAIRAEKAMEAKVYAELDALVADLQRLAPPGHGEDPTYQLAADPRFPLARDEDGRVDRNRRWKVAGYTVGLAALISVILILVVPNAMLYIALTALVVLILFIIAGFLGIF
ncbi:DUF1707 SHOCT-like domain-containing protein [Natronoglycomyces albus]|uniref:DUF1707 domain-containing protein n=1 Tax=Natronoglycomyces albus TaxID=2811108 RepID=A0A895XP28_9ACTN|nr:DUF1707 domain-containing protein [Natronoglycomyces albus]QSB05139.1 DUF1707 domain-containing protein [Natronoglycomyces albus]